MHFSIHLSFKFVNKWCIALVAPFSAAYFLTSAFCSSVKNCLVSASFLYWLLCNNYILPCWPPQLNSKEPVYLMNHEDLVSSHGVPLI